MSIDNVESQRTLSPNTYKGEPKQLFADLEAMIDRYSVRTVLDMLSNVCDAKADHVQANWQDAKLAKQWERAGTTLQRTIGKVHV